MLDPRSISSDRWLIVWAVVFSRIHVLVCREQSPAYFLLAIDLMMDDACTKSIEWWIGWVNVIWP